MIMLLGVEPDLKISAQDVQEFLPFVRVGFAAAATGFDAEKMRFHRRVSPGKKFHAHVRRRLQDFSLIRAHQARIIAGSFEEGKNVRAVKARDAAQRGDRGAHLAALESAEKSDRHAGGASYLSQRKAAPRTQAPETLPGMKRILRRSSDNSLALEYVDDGSRIETASPAQKNRTLQQAHIKLSKEAVAAPRALRRDQAQGFPGAQSGRRYAHAASHLADAQKAAAVLLCRCFG